MVRSTTADPLTGAAVSLFAQALLRDGVARIRLHGRSMLPALWPGVRVQVRQCAAADLVIGDVAFARRGSEFVAHRVMRFAEDGLILRGDALESDDPPIAFSDVLGRVEAIVVRDLEIALPPLPPPFARAGGNVYRALRAPTRRLLKKALRSTAVLRAPFLAYRIETIRPSHRLVLNELALARLRTWTSAAEGWVALDATRQIAIGLLLVDSDREIVDVYVRPTHRSMGIETSLREAYAAIVRSD